MNEKEAAEELIRISANPIRFLDYVYLRDPLKGKIKFEPWPHLIEGLTELEKNLLIVILKARQIGWSWLIAMRAVRKILTTPYANILLISKSEREATELLNKSRYVYQNLPDWMKQTTSYDSATTLGLQKMGSKITVLPCTGTAGIGEAATEVDCDEWDKWDIEVQEQNFASLKPTIDAGGKFIGLSTSDKSKSDSTFKKIFRGALSKENNFKALFYPWNVAPNRDQDWYERMRADYPDWQLQQEYPSSIQEALSPLSGKSVFGQTALEKLLNETVESETERGYIHIIHPPEVGVRYVGAGDVGEGVGLDYSAFNIIGTKGMQSEVCAVIHSNEIKTDIYAYEIYKLCEQYFFPLIGIENNTLGVAVLNKLVELGYPRLYSTKDKKGNVKKLGWTTSGMSRQTSLIELSTAIDNGSLITKYRPQVLELMSFYFDEGKAQAAKGSHDDLVMSLMIANQLIKTAPNASLPHIKLAGKPAPMTYSRT